MHSGDTIHSFNVKRTPLDLLISTAAAAAAAGGGAAARPGLSVSGQAACPRKSRSWYSVVLPLHNVLISRSVVPGARAAAVHCAVTTAASDSA